MVYSGVGKAVASTTDVHLFRIKIWDKDTGVVIYNNQMGDTDDADVSTAIGAGNVVMHYQMPPYRGEIRRGGPE